MNQLHQKLMNRFSWYSAYHNRPSYKKLNLALFGLLAGPFLVLAVVLTQPGLVQFLTSKADVGTEMVQFPNDKIAFIIGPQLKSGSSFNPHPWFDDVANRRGDYWGKAFPTVLPGKLSGTVTFTQGSTIVRGVGTKFLSEISVSTLGTGNTYFDDISYTETINNAPSRVAGKMASVQSDTQLTLTQPWERPTVSVAAEQGNWDAYLFGNYYDQALIQYTNYYRNRDKNPEAAQRYLSYARKIADSYWKMPFTNEGRNRNFDTANIPPRHSSLGGLMLRAMDPEDPRPEMWDWINYYTRHQFNLWLVDGPARNPGDLYYGVREGAYMLLYATELAKVLPDSYPLLNGGTETNGAAIRAKYLADAENVAVNYYGKQQSCDGSWRWTSRAYPDEPNWYVNGVNEGRVLEVMQPFQVGLLIQSLGDLYDLSTNSTAKNSVRTPWNPSTDANNMANSPGTNGIKAQITSAVAHLHTGGPWRDYPSGYQNYYWHGYHYFYHGGTDAVPDRFVNGSDAPTTNTDAAVWDNRAAIQTVLQAYGVAYHVSGDPKFVTWGDQVFAAGYGMPGEHPYADGIHNYADTPGEPKSYNEAFRASGRYLAYRLLGSAPIISSTPLPTPSVTSTLTPTPLPTSGIGPMTNITAPTNGSTISGLVLVTANASDNDGVDNVYLIVDDLVSGVDAEAPYTFNFDTSRIDDGSHSIYVRAWDKVGNAGDSSPITVTVSNLATQTPTPTPTPTPTGTPQVGDTLTPTVNSFNVTPLSAKANFTLSWTVSDSGGSHLNRVETKVASYNATNCSETNKTGCNWTTPSTIAAPTNSDTWTSTTKLNPGKRGTYWIGLQALDNAGNRGYEPAPVKVVKQ